MVMGREALPEKVKPIYAISAGLSSKIFVWEKIFYRPFGKVWFKI